MKILVSLLLLASVHASDWTYVDMSVKKDGVDFCKSETTDYAYHIDYKNQGGELSVWNRKTNEVDRYFYVREVFEGSAYRNATGEEVQATNPGHLNVTNLEFINAYGTAGRTDSSPYRAWVPECGKYKKS